ncbi:glycosyltransferase [Planococcus sp. MERTA32b]|nr:glycosyltransferase [Planococcus sp. MER TA 32b]
MDEALVSVIIPTYRRPVMLRRTIESVLGQTYSNVEVIVVDDNDPWDTSRKETKELMEEYRDNEKVKYLKHPYNKNGSAARNTGIRSASGFYIAFLDDDDEFLPSKLEKQVQRMRATEGTGVGGVYCNYKRYSKGKFSLSTAHKYQRDEGDLTADLLMEKNEIGAGSTLLITKSAAVELAGFDESFQRHQDWEFLLRFFKKYKLALCEESLVNVHADDQVNKKTPEQQVMIKNKYLQQFQREISSLDVSIQNRIYSRHWLVLAEAFFQAGDMENGWAYAKKALARRGLPVKGKIKLYAYRLNLFGFINGVFISSKNLLTFKERK